MKYIIDYDLIDKINTANGIIDMKKIMLKQLKRQLYFFSFYTGFDILSFGINDIQWKTNLLICSSFMIINSAIISALQNKYKDQNEFKACLELNKLAIDLGNKLNVNTNFDLLKQSELKEVDYRLMTQKGIPYIKQEKYILVPAYDGLENMKKVSILQEHEIGSKEYVLSIGSPKKALELKPVFNI